MPNSIWHKLYKPEKAGMMEIKSRLLRAVRTEIMNLADEGSPIHIPDLIQKEVLELNMDLKIEKLIELAFLLNLNVELKIEGVKRDR